MAPKKNRRKACWNCDSEVDLDIMICPYCASDLSSSAGRRQEVATPQTMERIPQPVYRPIRTAEPPRGSMEPMDASDEAMVPDGTIGSIKTFLLTLLCFLMGSVAFLFALALMFLADGETLTLRWQAALWPLFLIIALPLLLLGYKSWRHLDQ
jgi:hypothetical protein